MYYLDDDIVPDDDLSNVAFEDDAFDELQSVVNKAMKLKTKKEPLSNEKVRDIISSFFVLYNKRKRKENMKFFQNNYTKKKHFTFPVRFRH